MCRRQGALAEARAEVFDFAGSTFCESEQSTTSDCAGSRSEEGMEWEGVGMVGVDEIEGELRLQRNV